MTLIIMDCCTQGKEGKKKKAAERGRGRGQTSKIEGMQVIMPENEKTANLNQV